MLYGKSKRKITGGKRTKFRKRRKASMKRYTLDCKLGDVRRKKVDVRGGNEKTRLQFTDNVNLTDPSDGTTTVVDVEDVLENPANQHLARRNIITKGAIVQTSEGKAKITSRPGQSGTLNAVKIEE